ncbi:MAG: pantoate--beta-alanine ligase [Actinobacteria bacterium]|jgi:pantoate--beta-alanine ligase|nr:pantoate--beta-alanine ligase [Actinomycetota bacterium]
MMPHLVTTSTEVRALPAAVGPRLVVMTMGALHEGHAELIREARRRAGAEGTVLVTIFVNPTQFGAGEDFGRYPRTLDDDLTLCAEAGADVVWTPDVQQVYGNPDGFRDDSVTIDPGPLGRILEGASRPDHFRGMLTVVAKLLAVTAPDEALYGEKDYQQLVLIQRMARDLSMSVAISGVPTVREPDGLARSSRNRYLSGPEREVASVVPKALHAAVAAARDGAQAALEAGRAVVADVRGITLDYLVVTDPELAAAPTVGEGRVLIAARVGSTRLIDNMACRLGA